MKSISNVFCPVSVHKVSQLCCWMTPTIHIMKKIIYRYGEFRLSQVQREVNIANVVKIRKGGRKRGEWEENAGFLSSLHARQFE